MESESRPQFRFGPSKRYLPGKKLVAGDVLTMNILNVPVNWEEEPEESVVGVGMVTWRTVCNQAKELVLAVRKWDIDLVKHATWVYKLTVTETGYDLEEIA